VDAGIERVDDGLLESVEERLNAEQRRIDRAIAELHSVELDDGPDEHDRGQPAWTSEDAAQAANDTLSREVGFGLIDEFSHGLDEVEDARSRLRDGRYGRCETCGAAICADRLAAVPATRWCVACATHVEHEARWRLSPLPPMATHPRR
jgi:RNA polymerase-binding transcription factor DksA